MSEPDDLDAARARADALAHEVEALERENAALRSRLPAAEPVPAPAARRRRRMWPLVLSLTLVPLAIAAAIFWLVLPSVVSHVHGTISASGSALGTWTMHPDRCQSGQRNQFRGVDLFAGSTDAHGTAFIQPIGSEPIVTINMATRAEALEFHRADCKVLEGDVERQRSTVNDIRNVRGHVRFDCTSDGEHATGDVTFENCH